MLRKSLLLCVIVPPLYIAYTFILGCKSSKVGICSVTLEDGSDTAVISKIFRFSVSATPENGNLCSAPAGNFFMGTCYAFIKCYSWTNALDTTTFRLTFDKKMLVGKDTLRENTNVLGHSLLGTIRSTSRYGSGNGCSIVNYEIGSSDTAVMRTMTFDTSIYKATFTCTTTDGKALLAECYVRFN